MKKTIHFITYVAVFSAIGVVFDLISGLIFDFAFLQGGCINIGLVPIFIVGSKYGPKGSLLTGLIIGTLQLVYAKYFINAFQVLLDYVLPFTVVGLIGFFNNGSHKLPLKEVIIKLIIGTIIITTLRLLSLTLSGCLYWNTGFIPSLIYNMTYTIPTGIVSLLIYVLLHKLKAIK